MSVVLRMAGIYLHIPFCKQACHYCDFHFSTSRDYTGDLLDALVKEISLQKNYLKGQVVSTIYFGGGTPSLLSAGELRSIIDALSNNFSIHDQPEVTLEANPDDLTETKLIALKQLGVNRLSIGIQSFHDSILLYLNRAHDSNSARSCIPLARAAGFENISIDLIYAIPQQTMEMWKSDIEEVIQLNPEHISCYSLTIEPKTAFGAWAKSGKLKIVEDELAAEQLELLIDSLESAGYEHYEVSNFAKPGFYSKHNSSYWKQSHYLGIGPSAHSYNGVSRQYNVAHNHRYMDSIKKGFVPFELEILSSANLINEYLLTTLRTSWGCDVNLLMNQFNYDLLGSQKRYIDQLISTGFITLSNSHLVLTKKGKLVADKIASDLFIS